MFVIFKEVEFSAAHFIPGHPGDCKNLHGHTYKVRVYIKRKKLNELNMVMDFSELALIIQKVLGKFDHKLLNELREFKKLTPTAENIAYVIFKKIKKLLPKEVKISKIEVYESDSSCAIFSP